ncbi:hypothetical protein BH10PSE11_BH10PSE11_04560 [soil metagenome]
MHGRHCVRSEAIQINSWIASLLALLAMTRSDFKPNSYFGYLNSGAAFSASLVVFIFADHVSLSLL